MIATTTTAFAQTVYSEQYQRIQSIELAEITVDENGNEVESLVQKQRIPTEIEHMINAQKKQSNRKANIGEVIKVTRELIALGKEIYKIVEAGRPVVNINKMTPVSVLPKTNAGAPVDPMDLDGWKAPIYKKYKVSYKNYLGGTPASFTFMLMYSYGGSENGKGKYITGALIKATDVTVKWGYSLDADFKVLSIMNAGSRDNKVAAAVLEINYKVSTVLQSTDTSETFYINGAGKTIAY